MKNIILFSLYLFSASLQLVNAQETKVRVSNHYYYNVNGTLVLNNEEYFAGKGNYPQVANPTQSLTLTVEQGVRIPESHSFVEFNSSQNIRTKTIQSQWDAQSNTFTRTEEVEDFFSSPESTLTDSTVSYVNGVIFENKSFTYDEEGRIALVKYYSSPVLSGNQMVMNLMNVDSLFYYSDSSVTRSYLTDVSGYYLVSLNCTSTSSNGDTVITKSYSRTGSKSEPIEATAYSEGFSAFMNYTISKAIPNTAFFEYLIYSREAADAIAGNSWTSILKQQGYNDTETSAFVIYMASIIPESEMVFELMKSETYQTGSHLDSVYNYSSNGVGGLNFTGKSINKSTNSMSDSLLVYTQDFMNPGSFILVQALVNKYATDYPNSLPRYFPDITSNESINFESPVGFALNQNYPNPFNPSTQIEFTLNKAGFARLTVFDMLGREVKTLVNTQLSQGTHSFQFDANNLASGMYIYRLDIAGQSLTRKMTLVK
ncbi:T9SS type A sorting domain-containing protein [bacterium]|nr:MAG: T9SS type A sorting domain-containing protein [bacterium]